MNIITQISKMLNFDTIYHRTTDGTNLGAIFPNGTVTGNLKLVNIQFTEYNHTEIKE